MADGDVVASGTVQVPYQITEYTVDGVTRYDYYDSDEFFDTIEDAIRSFKNKVGGALMGDMVEVRIGSTEADVLVVGKLEGRAPYMFWKRVVVDPSTVDVDKLVERLQASNTRWEGYLDAHGNYVLLLPPIFKINKTETVF